MTEHESPRAAGGSEDDLRFETVYLRLKELASRQRSRIGTAGMLCTTELVHETYLRLGRATFGAGHVAQFLAYAAKAMRHILVDGARQRHQPKRGGDQVHLSLSDEGVDSVYVDAQLALQLDQALVALERDDQRAARVVELYYFAGLSLQQVADILGVTRRTVDRDWRYARAMLAASAGS